MLTIDETDGLQQISFDAEFGLSFYDPYVSEPSLDLSPYLEDIDLDTNQQSEIFELVSTSPPKDLVKGLQQQELLSTFLHENDYSYLIQENGTIFVDCDDTASMTSQTVPTNPFDLQSSGSSAPPSPELPSDTRKLKSKRGRKGSIKARSLAKDTYEYRVKRERNNVAVRKSRMKTKEKHVEIFRQVSELTDENEDLHSTVATLTKELHRLKNYLKNSGLSNISTESQLV
ncbi:CCAAT/enhancer-binding protein [Salmonella sp. s54412]|uniref:CCAAT/enhancer-binding protein n=1 Tax=Salmonella sp. s54412 TaxID=3160128 RepID=UPI003754F382